MSGRLVDAALPKPNGVADGLVVSGSVPQDEVWYVQDAFLVVSSSVDNGISDGSYNLTFAIGVPKESGLSDGVESLEVLHGSYGSYGSEMDEPLGERCDLAGNAGHTVSIGGYMYGEEQFAVRERSDGEASDAQFRFVIRGRQVE